MAKSWRLRLNNYWSGDFPFKRANNKLDYESSFFFGIRSKHATELRLLKLENAQKLRCMRIIAK